VSEELTLSPGRVDELVRSGEAELVDVRTSEEREAGHAPGDRHVPFEDLTTEIPALDADRPVIFYCRSGDRSAVAAEAVRAAGRQAYSIEGGLLAWAEQGLPLEPDGGEVAVHSALPPP
jgi:rhodanese-related sulfurtransferase